MVEEAQEVPAKRESAFEKTYDVEMRPALFSWLAESLRPQYERELAERRRDGSYNDLDEFHRSRISRVMREMLDQFPSPNEIPKNPHLNLSKEDIAMLNTAIPSPSTEIQRRTNNLLKDELKEKFESARMGVKIGEIRAKVSSFFKRKV